VAYDAKGTLGRHRLLGFVLLFLLLAPLVIVSLLF
jgi:hypothetical protein